MNTKADHSAYNSCNNSDALFLDSINIVILSALHASNVSLVLSCSVTVKHKKFQVVDLLVEY